MTDTLFLAKITSFTYTLFGAAFKREFWLFEKSTFFNKYVSKRGFKGRPIISQLLVFLF